MIVAVGPQDNIVFVLICLDGLDSARANILEINGSGFLVGDPFICFCSGHFEDAGMSSVLLFWENGDPGAKSEDEGVILRSLPLGLYSKGYP